VPKIKIENHCIVTGMGKLNEASSPSTLPFLTDEEREEFNVIGYTGKDSAGKRTSHYEFLNSLGKGTFEIHQTKFGGDDFVEKFMITRAYTNNS
jgi:hypothetical protein